MITIERCLPTDKDAALLMDELSSLLREMTGSDGRIAFVDWLPNERTVFVIARQNGEAVGCGAVRPFNETVAEVKRMYAKYPGLGIGRAILTWLETFAREAGYQSVWLETRRVNEAACAFYRRSGYREIENYGRYQGRTECICFGKDLT